MGVWMFARAEKLKLTLLKWLLIGFIWLCQHIDAIDEVHTFSPRLLFIQLPFYRMLNETSHHFVSDVHRIFLFAPLISSSIRIPWISPISCECVLCMCTLNKFLWFEHPDDNRTNMNPKSSRQTEKKFRLRQSTNFQTNVWTY